ncbi:uncharacterized protein SOCEGT47_037460 [Sorangium cellulosum]|uniref:Secreted protein n=2 Tax=Sorangium cellulosum TaxID=56 RepID=A0A4P2Q2X6_SORCE|nr:uncharacterized protein SOCEGT47_037460 [Sorangium cellulosum]
MGRWARRVGVAAAVGSISALATQAGALTTAGSWKGNTYSASDIVGAHAQGNAYVSNNRVYVTGYVRDTLSDGHGACLQIQAWYDDDFFPREEFVADTDGNNSSYEYFSFHFDASTIEEIWIQECLTESGDIWDTAPGWQVIVWP